MTYRLSMPVRGNMRLEVETETIQKLIDAFTDLGGDAEWLRNAARGSIVSAEAGEAAGIAAQGLGGTLISNEPTEPKAFQPLIDAMEQQEAKPEPTRVKHVSDDPWSTTPELETPGAALTGVSTIMQPDDKWPDPNEWPGEATVARDALTSRKPQVADPWDTGEDEPFKPPEPDPNGPKRDQFGREFRFNQPDAPNCLCGETAAKMKARSKQSKQLYYAWVCARGMSDNWSNKCDFREYLD